MEYYIFGGNGFVGRYLANEFVRLGHKVVVCDLHPKLDHQISNSCKYEKVDIRDVNQINRLPISDVNTVINLAANQYHTKIPLNRSMYFRNVNVFGTENLLSVIYNKGCRNFLMFSTDMIYGKPLYLPIDTGHPHKPIGPYGKSKKDAELICMKYRGKGMNITIIRPRMINGPGRLGILVKLFKLIDSGLPVPMIGNGKNHYQMISVFDCVSAIICAINKNLPNKEYNLGSIGSPCIRDLLQLVIKSANSKSILIPTWGFLVKAILSVFDILQIPLMYREQFMIADKEYVLDISETESDLSWSPKYNDADMINAAYSLYKSI